MTRPHEKWLTKAEDDLKFARLGLESGFYGQVCFLAQQSIEKNLKGFLLFKEMLYPKTHKLVELGKLCSEIEKELSRFTSQLKIIDEYYISTRYPDAVPGSTAAGSPSKENAKEVLEIAEEIHNVIRRWIKGK